MIIDNCEIVMKKIKVLFAFWSGCSEFALSVGCNEFALGVVMIILYKIKSESGACVGGEVCV